jgi:acetyltransferase-like isoleucine patch superfamily enzyme
VHFNGLHIKGAGRVTIGDNFHSGQQILFITEHHDYDHGSALPYDPVRTLVKDITIANNVWLGDRVVILGGTTIGEGAIIQAGSVVVSDIPDCAIAGGHPAKVFKYRDREHYGRLKAMGRYC